MAELRIVVHLNEDEARIIIDALEFRAEQTRANLDMADAVGVEHVETWTRNAELAEATASLVNNEWISAGGRPR